MGLARERARSHISVRVKYERSFLVKFCDFLFMFVNKQRSIISVLFVSQIPPVRSFPIRVPRPELWCYTNPAVDMQMQNSGTAV